MQFSKAEKYLMNKDKKLNILITENGPINFKPNNKNPFDLLIEIVVSQFISTKAAHAIKSKINLQFNVNHLLPEHFENLSIKKIKELGLSTNKSKCIAELTKLFLSNKFRNNYGYDNDAFRRDLGNIFGIGPWSLNMYDIFLEGKSYLENKEYKIYGKNININLSDEVSSSDEAVEVINSMGILNAKGFKSLEYEGKIIFKGEVEFLTNE